jgi:hypothetical protein
VRDCDIEIFNDGTWQPCGDSRQEGDIELLFLNTISHENYERFADALERLRIDTERFVEPSYWEDEDSI